MLLYYVSLGLQFVCVLCFCLVLIHAFGRGLGAGLMVLLIPCYNIYYALFEFEHRFRGWVVAGFLVSPVAAISLRLLPWLLAAPAPPAPPLP